MAELLLDLLVFHKPFGDLAILYHAIEDFEVLVDEFFGIGVEAVGLSDHWVEWVADIIISSAI